MNPRHSFTVEAHPERDVIMAGFAERKSLRQIQAQLKCPISVMALQRYRKSVVVPALRDHEILARAKAMAKSPSNAIDASVTDAVTEREMIAVTKAALLADPILSRMENQRERRASWMNQAEAEKDFRALTGLDRNELTDIELHARLTGRLESSGSTTTNMYVLVNATPQVAARPRVVDVEPEK